MTAEEGSPGLMPRKVLLFSGHMIDAPGRKEPRFRPDRSRSRPPRIASTLDGLGVGPEDLAICSGACGGDLLFAEAALVRRAALEIYIPFEEPTSSRTPWNSRITIWRERFLCREIACDATPVVPEVLGAAARRQRTLTSAPICGCSNRRCGSAPRGSTSSACGTYKRGDGPGGTQHMMKESRARFRTECTGSIRGTLWG